MGASFEEYTIPIIWTTMSKTSGESGEEVGPTYDAIDCHDFAEDDAIRRGI